MSQSRTLERVVDLNARAIAPEALELVKLAVLVMEHVNEQIAKVKQNPTSTRAALTANCANARLIQFVLDVVRDSLNVALDRATHNQERVSVTELFGYVQGNLIGCALRVGGEDRGLNDGLKRLRLHYGDPFEEVFLMKSECAAVYGPNNNTANDYDQSATRERKDHRELALLTCRSGNDRRLANGLRTHSGTRGNRSDTVVCRCVERIFDYLGDKRIVLSGVLQ